MKMRNKMAILALALLGIAGASELYSSGAYARVCFLVGGCRTKTGKLEKFLNSRGENVVATGVDVKPNVIDQDCGSLGFVKCKKPDLSSMKCMKNGEIWTEKCMCNENDEFPYTYGTDMNADRVGALCCNSGPRGCPRQSVSPGANLQTPYTGRENPGCDEVNTSEICYDSLGAHFKHKICKAGFGYVLTETNALVSGIHNPVTVCQSPNAIGTDLSCVEVNHLAGGASPVTRYSGCECPVEYQYMMSDIPSDAFTIDTVTAAQNKEYCFKNIQRENIDNINLYKASARKCSGKAEAGGFWKSDYDSSTEYYDPEEDETWDGLTCHLVKPKCDKTVYKYLAGDDMAYSESLPNYMPGRNREIPEWVGIEQAKPYVGAGEMCVDNEGKHFQYKICKSRYGYRRSTGTGSTDGNVSAALNTGIHFVPDVCTYNSVGSEDYCDEKYDLAQNDWGGLPTQVRKYEYCECPAEYKYTYDEVEELDGSNIFSNNYMCYTSGVGADDGVFKFKVGCTGYGDEDDDDIGEWREGPCSTGEYLDRTATWHDTTCNLCKPRCDKSVYKYTYGEDEDMGPEQSTNPGAIAQHPTLRARKYTGAGASCSDDEGDHYQYKICKARYSARIDTGTASTDSNVAQALNTGYHNPITKICSYGGTGSSDYCVEKYDLNNSQPWYATSVTRYSDCTNPNTNYYGY